MDISEISWEQFRAARNTLGLSQRFIAKETSINRTLLALFEVGKYNLEPDKRQSLANYYERLGYRFDVELPSAPTVSQSIYKNEFAQPVSSQKLKLASANNSAKLPCIFDGIIISSEIAKNDFDRISTEINRNDAIIKRLANKTVDLALFTHEPRTKEHETIIRLMARKYQLICELQGRALFPEQSGNSAKNNSYRQKTAGELAIEVLNSEIELPETI